MLRTIWGAMRSRYPRRRQAVVMVSVLVLVLLMVGAGLVVAGAAGLAWTETLGFCTGCHEMRDNPYKEYQDTIHDKNRAGVRAVCSDCHVPREPGPLILRKMAATFEVFGHLRGVINTREKFLAHREELAHHVWKRMKETDSLECRNCHDAKHMDPSLQSAGAQAKHKLMQTQGKTCIDCHYGIAHDEPKGPTPEELFPNIKVQRWKEKPSDAPAT
jgi:cytochrome c-type protein NapC